jgi:hypothetical protein
MEQIDRIGQLERLQGLREQGALTEAEFAHEKSLVLYNGVAEVQPVRRSRAPLVLGLVVVAMGGGVLLGSLTPTTVASNAPSIVRHHRAASALAEPPAPAPVTGESPASDEGFETADRDGLAATAVPLIKRRWLKVEAECRNGERSPEDGLCLASNEAARALRQARGLLDL